MGWKPWAMALALSVVAAPMLAWGDSPPQVVLATPGGAGGDGGVIDRYTVRFSEAMVPLGDPRAAAPFAVKCPVGGTGRWVDPQTYVHEFEKALPGGVTCTVTMRDGLASVRNVRLTGQRSYTIDTGGPSVRAILPGEYDGDIEEDQLFLIAANTAPDARSVTANGYCAVDGIGERIALDVQGPAVAADLIARLGTDQWAVRNFLEDAGLPSRAPAGAADRATAYRGLLAIKCRRPLPPGRDVAIVWSSRISGPGGRLAGRDQRFDFTVRKEFSARFECSRVNPQAGCNPVLPAFVRFTAPVPVASVKAIRLSFPDGTVLTPTLAKEDENSQTVSDVRFAKPLPFDMKGTLRLPPGLVDESGRPLANAQRFPLEVRIDAPPPLVKFAAPFGIVEAKEGGVLPVTVRAVEPEVARRVDTVRGDMLRVDASDGEIARWLRDLDAAEERDVRIETRGKEEVRVNYTGTRSLLRGRGESLALALPGRGKAFEVIGLELREPGFYVVELASPALGRSLLGRDATRYVSAGALVTNMAVHFKWGREASLAWVTTLDGAAPVAGADVRVTDSCTGATLARGTTDRQGRLLVQRGSIPKPETYGSCREGSESHPLMISARSGGDFSFTLTDWSDGIRPYDFDLRYGYSESDDILHTVFDRSLVREGETVHMKHILRRPVGSGFAYADTITGKLILTHSGSGTEFALPLAIGRDGVGETQWNVPKGAPQGDYALRVEAGEKTVYTGQSVRVDEYRLPTMKATVTGPRLSPVRPRTVSLDLYAGYLSGGPAAGLPVSLRTAFSRADAAPEGWDGWSFGGRPVREGTVPLSGDGDPPAPPLPLAQTLPATLRSDGTAKAMIEIGQEIDEVTAMMVEMDYEDANGETLTASRRILLLPAAVQLGIKTDGWLMRDSDLRLKIATLDLEGRAARGRPVRVELFRQEVLTARRRLIGGFYAYDNQMRVTRIGGGCTVSTNRQGLAECAMAPGVSGEVIVVATTTDADGNVARAVRSVWLAGEEEWWFGGDNGDRMDLIPEAKAYRAGETARFQVRMPFREATALVTVEREGVLSSFVTTLSGKDPVIKVPMPGGYAPNVAVSVLAVRGRVSGWRQWLAETAREWKLPFFDKAGGTSATVDLAKPAYRLGMAQVQVGWEANALAVKVKADKARYAVRETASVAVQVSEPGGKPARSAEIAFAAVDEALLQLSPNESWRLIEAMMNERPVSVLTSTAQMQVVGKRTYGRKAVEAGGGGGDASAVTRDDFKPVLLWRGRVALDDKGRAQIPVQLSDSLSAFRLVAIAHAGTGLFGTGETTVRSAQDLQLFSGLPPLVRTGDRVGASFTLRNGTDRPMTVTATMAVSPNVVSGEPVTVDIPAGGAVPVTWDVTAPDLPGDLAWVVEARSNNGKAIDRIAVTQRVMPAVPLEIWAATLTRAGNGIPIPVAAPEGALPGGFVDIRLSETLAPPLEGVRAYMGDYPYNCFEQRLSRAVVLGDSAGWERLAAEIPAYLDSDGLLRYFPIASLQGSEALTAYVLSMTAEAGWTVPEAARQRMMTAMRSVLDGRLRREAAWGGDPRLLRVAALAALARNGGATPAMLGAVNLAPADMPTTTLADWIAAIDRTRGANAALRVAAERTLRQRLVYEGSRLDLADAAGAPWWMMSSGDESAIKALLAALGRPGWNDEAPKMMVGVSLRQRRGHWDTTLANAWGSIAARRFAALYPASAVAGTTTASLGDQTASQPWPLPADAGPLRLALPGVQTPLRLTHSGGAGPWAMVSVRAAVPLRAPLFAGYRVERATTMLVQKTPGQLTRGDVMQVRLTVEAGAGRNWVVISDPVPPGATIIGGLGGQSQLLRDAGPAEDGVSPSYVERGNDAWRGYFEWVPRGRFTVHYAVRLNGSGRFTLPPTRVEAMYSPEIRGQLPNAPVTIALR